MLPVLCIFDVFGVNDCVYAGISVELAKGPEVSRWPSIICKTDAIHAAELEGWFDG